MPARVQDACHAEIYRQSVLFAEKLMETQRTPSGPSG
jgi:hypothetical protein